MNNNCNESIRREDSLSSYKANHSVWQAQPYYYNHSDQEDDTEEEVSTHNGYKLMMDTIHTNYRYTLPESQDSEVYKNHMNNLQDIIYKCKEKEIRSETDLLKSVDNQVSSVSRKVGSHADDIPTGIFCASKTDLVKLDQLLLKIDTALDKSEKSNRWRCNIM